MSVARGSVVVVDLEPTLGHEQRGTRPCVVVSDPLVVASQRFSMICVVPLTGTAGEGLLYPPIAAGNSGLSRTSFALIDQIRSIDKRRVRRVVGMLLPDEVALIDAGIIGFLGLFAGQGPSRDS